MSSSTFDPQAASDESNAANALALLLRTLRRHWALVVASVVLFTGGALFVTRLLPRVYDAAALIELNASVARPLGDKTDETMALGGAPWWDTQEYYETQYQIVTSNRVLSAVAHDLGLAGDLDFMGSKATHGQETTTEDAVTVLRGHVRVDPIKNSRLFLLHVEDTDPKRARRVCSAIATTYIDQNLQTAINGSSDAVVWLDGQIDHVKSELETNENALYDFKQRNDLPSTSINDAANMLRVEMQELDTTLTKTRTKKEELLARYSELSKVSSDDPDDLPASELLASPFLQSLRSQFQDAIKNRAALVAEGKGENHPLVKAATEKVSTTRTALLAEVENIKGAVKRDLDIVTKEEAGDSALFEATRKRAVDLSMKEIEYHRLDRTREENEKLYAMLLERFKDADLARMMHINNIRLVDDAQEPRRPIRPRTLLNVALGLALGLAFGLGLVWLRERLDTSLKTPDDLERQLGVTFLGLIPAVEADLPTYGRTSRRQKRAAPTSGPQELVVHRQPLSGVAEAARSIRTNLLFMNPDRPYRRLLVTSAAPAEGKTMVACSIAIALAQGGQRVCIVDCDLRRPRLHRIFDRSGDDGLTNVLVGEAPLADVVKPTGIENLWSIPAGPLPPNPADVLHSERFRKVISELSEMFDRVVIDSPPLVAVTDAAIVSTLVDGTVFVVRAFQTSKHLSAQGLRGLKDVDAPVAGAVLNAVNLERDEYSHYYHYYYYKREGYRTGDSPDDDGESRALPPN